MTDSDIKLEWQTRFTLDRRTDQDIADLVRELNGDGKPVVEKTGIEVDLRETKHIGKDDTKITFSALDTDEYRIGVSGPM